MYQVSRHGLPEPLPQKGEELPERRPREAWERAEQGLPLPKPDCTNEPAFRTPDGVSNVLSRFRVRGTAADRRDEGV
ncbi:hypothetical protein [Streptomyces sp. NPDC047718]|uniref:hypothetical protein n=1 Tax=Streptomyces sp. NPDC047718 TaxID=3155479 RepID=UPI0033E2BD2F